MPTRTRASASRDATPSPPRDSRMPPRPVPEDALVDDAPGGATAASIAELEKRLTAQAEALEKRLAGQFEAATAALLARLAPPTNPLPPEGTQPANPAGTP